MTQADFGAAIGRSEFSVRNWEQGRADPRPPTLERISEVLGKPVSWFYGEDDAPEDELAALLRRQQAELQRLQESMGDQYPALRERTPPYPGVVELLADKARCSALRVTEDERSMLEEGWCYPRGPRDADEAVDLLLALRRMSATASIDDD